MAQWRFPRPPGGLWRGITWLLPALGFLGLWWRSTKSSSPRTSEPAPTGTLELLTVSKDPTGPLLLPALAWAVPSLLKKPPFGGLRARVGPSVLAGDLSDISGEAQKVVQAGADYVHLDVFDGNWIPGAFTFGPMVIKALQRHVPGAFLDVHLCVTNPVQYLRELAQIGVSRVTVHIEAIRDPAAVAEQGRSLGLSMGLAIAPSTPATAQLLQVAQFFDLILVMTVPPGFGGQAFMPEVLPKVEALRARYPEKAVEVDGGVNVQTARLAGKAGANEAVAGTSVFKAQNVLRAIQDLRRSLQEGLSSRQTLATA